MTTMESLGIDRLTIDERRKLIDEITQSLKSPESPHSIGNGSHSEAKDGPSPSSIDGGIKAAAHWLIDRLPADATWDDLRYQAYVRREIDAGLEDSRAGRTVSLEEARREFGLSPRRQETSDNLGVKNVARRLVDGLSDNATWEDVRYQIYAGEKISRGLRESREGRTISHEEVCRRFGVTPE